MIYFIIYLLTFLSTGHTPKTPNQQSNGKSVLEGSHKQFSLGWTILDILALWRNILPLSRANLTRLRQLLDFLHTRIMIFVRNNKRRLIFLLNTGVARTTPQKTFLTPLLLAPSLAKFLTPRGVLHYNIWIFFDFSPPRLQPNQKNTPPRGQFMLPHCTVPNIIICCALDFMPQYLFKYFIFLPPKTQMDTSAVN